MTTKQKLTAFSEDHDIWDKLVSQLIVQLKTYAPNLTDKQFYIEEMKYDRESLYVRFSNVAPFAGVLAPIFQELYLATWTDFYPYAINGVEGFFGTLSWRFHYNSGSNGHEAFRTFYSDKTGWIIKKEGELF